MVVAAGPVVTERTTPAALDDELEFCRRSLRDLETELIAGDIDRADYQTLTDAYTARAAAALRQLDCDDPEPPVRPGRTRLGEAAKETGHPTPAAAEEGGDGPRPRWGWRKTVVAATGVTLVAGGAAWSVMASSGARLPGQVITGEAPRQAVAQSLAKAQQAVERGDDITALKDYQQVLDAIPDQPEALAGKGWILAQTQQPDLLGQAVTILLSAERADPSYAPAHLYRGIALFSQGNYSAAVPELQWYLAHQPDPQLATKVRLALQRAQTQAAATTKPGQ